jgi:hypothetical protein
LISNDRLDATKCPFRLVSLNLSHNKLSHFLNYVAELGLINPETTERLDLVQCEINDEHIISLIQSEKLNRVEHLDLTGNQLEKTYTLLLKYLRESCDHLRNLYLRDNPGLKSVVNNFQIAKAKKSSGFPLVERLDLCRALRGDLAAQ